MTEGSASWSWLAGFFDGEGCLHIARGRRASGVVDLYPQIIVASTNRPVMELVASMIEAPLRTGKQRPNWRRKWSVTLCSAPACAAVIEKLLPHMVLKKTEATLFLEFCRTFAGGAQAPGSLDEATRLRRLELYDALKAEREREWPK